VREIYISVTTAALPFASIKLPLGSSIPYSIYGLSRSLQAHGMPNEWDHYFTESLTSYTVQHLNNERLIYGPYSLRWEVSNFPAAVSTDYILLLAAYNSDAHV